MSGLDLGCSIYNNAVNGTVGATGIPSNGVFSVGSTIFSNVNANSFYPTVSSALINAGVNPQNFPTLYDFNGKPRSATQPTVGAYVSDFLQLDIHMLSLHFAGIFDDNQSWLRHR